MKIEIEIPDRVVQWIKYGVIIVACLIIGIVLVSRCSGSKEQKAAEEVAEVAEEAVVTVPVEVSDFTEKATEVTEDAAEDATEVVITEGMSKREIRRAEKAARKAAKRAEKEAEEAAKQAEKDAKRAEKAARKAARKGIEVVEVAEPVAPKLLFGIEEDLYDIIEEEVQSGQTLSHLLDVYGVTPYMVDKIATTAKPTFDFRSIRAGNNYTVFLRSDSVSQKLYHFVYEKNNTDYVVVSIEGDSVQVREGQKEVTLHRRQVSADISSSLWNCMMEHDLPAALSVEMEDIFGWSVDFFALTEGDEFTVIYDEKFIDTMRVGVGQVWGALFTHNGKPYYAIPFKQGDKVTYWDENGNSLRKQLLKAPVKFTRISSKFSNARLHPIYRVYRPHHGVDYAAPAGTPVVAIADGTVIRRGWDSGGGGNYIRIRHANNLESAYLHLRGFASGIAVGTHVSQGQVIGYVGSTGASTGPHLDFRLYKGGTAIDPLKAPSEPVEPISAANKVAFEAIRDRVMAELAGPVADSVRILRADLYPDEAAGVTE